MLRRFMLMVFHVYAISYGALDYVTPFHATCRHGVIRFMPPRARHST